MDNEKDNEFIINREETAEPVVPATDEPRSDPAFVADSHDAQGHHSHGHAPDESEAIVWHQEKLLPTMLLATVLVVITIFGLATAGNTKLDVLTGKAAYDKVQAEIEKTKEVNMNPASGNSSMNIEPKHRPQRRRGSQLEGSVGH
jgi:hypothetical protein